MIYLPRTLEKVLDEYLMQFSAVVLTGPRRAGKSTLLEKHLSQFHLVSLDALDVRQFAREDPRGFLSRHTPPVIIDEIQYVPELFPYIKERVDKDPSKKGQWVLTGSQHFAMMEELKEALAGRVGLLSLLPFSISEAVGDAAGTLPFPVWWNHGTKGNLKARTTQDWTKFVLPTLYPEPYLARGSFSPDRWVDSYIQTVIDRDLKSHIAPRHLANFGKFVSLLATRVSQQTNASSMASEIGVDTKTVQAWMLLLQKARIIFELTPYYRNFGKRITKSPKIYFFDTGIVCYLCGITNAEQLLRGPLAGPLFENLAVSEFQKMFCHTAQPIKMFYWRSHGGLEVDLILEKDLKLYPIEIKATGTPMSAHVQPIIQVRKLSDQFAEEGLIVTSRPESVPLPGGVTNVHWSTL